MSSFKVFLSKIKPIHLLIITVLVLISYASAINNEFLSDDIGLFTDANKIGKFSYIFGEPQTIAKTTLNFVVFKIFGSSPAAFRLITIFFHFGTCLMVYILFIALTNNPSGALLAGSLTAVHPILVESVTWISAGSYVIYSFFFLLSLYFYSLSKHNYKKILPAIIFFILAVLISEKALPLFLIYPVYEIAFGNLRHNFKKTLPFAIFVGIWLLLIFWLFRYPQFRSANLIKSYYSESGLYNPLIQIPTAITTYFELIFWPQNLSFYHSEFVMNFWQYSVKISGLVIFLVALIYSFFKNKFIFFFLSFYIISLLVTLTPFKIAWIVAERYAYLGSVSILIIFAYLISKMISKYPRFKSLLYVTFMVIIIALTTRTVMRNSDWKTADNLWLATGKTAPSDPKTHNNLGDYYGRHGDLDRAIAEFSRAIELQSNYADAYHNRGNTYVQKKNYEKALEDYLMAVKYNPNIWQTHQNLAAIYFNSGDYQKSIDHLQKAISLYPTSPYLYTSLAIVYEKVRDKKSTINALDKAKQLDPNFHPPPELLDKLK